MKADTILTLPAYYQVDPAEIPRLLSSGGGEDDNFHLQSIVGSYKVPDGSFSPDALQSPAIDRGNDSLAIWPDGTPLAAVFEQADGQRIQAAKRPAHPLGKCIASVQLLAYLLVEFLLDYVLKIEFRQVRWRVICYVTLFFAGGKLKRVPVSGGPSQVICDAPTGADTSTRSVMAKAALLTATAI